MYHIYLITFKTSGKQYVGYTGVGVFNRLHKHYINAISGNDTHLYRAIRLYGAVDMVIEVLEEVDTKKEAVEKEKYYIDKFDTFKNGYNQTTGGDGGWSVPAHKKKAWLESLSERAKGKKNPNALNITNEEILNRAVAFFIENDNRLIRSHWLEYSRQEKLPRNYTKYRFGGGYKNFIKALKAKLDELDIPYKDTSFKLTKEERYSPHYQGAVAKYAKNN